DLTHSCHHLLGHRAREHQQRPLEVWPVQLSKLVHPQRDRTHSPRSWRPPTVLARTKVHFPALHHQLPLKRRELHSLGHAGLHFHAGVVQWSEDRRNEEGEQTATLHFVDQIERGLYVFVCLVGVADYQRHRREPVVCVQDGQALNHHARPVVDREWHTLARHNLLGHAKRGGLQTDQRHQSLLLRMRAEVRQVNRALRQQDF